MTRSSAQKPDWFTLTLTRSPAQKPAHKDLEPEWLGLGHSGSRSLILRFLTGLAHAHFSIITTSCTFNLR
ncbi:hypothetical protein BVJ53_03960 [Lacticaseibacillus chiayiensis]|uniref:Uncharacterized protein n=1 Tax=Lacticaseibacillus chiayiensis TaxID=2100821 RepID=A0A4Q1U8Z4_9LACO|nr:hypothetical protein BVJ53_03960 [Lacticaseibacillus chiayiensis]